MRGSDGFGELDRQKAAAQRRGAIRIPTPPRGLSGVVLIVFARVTNIQGEMIMALERKALEAVFGRLGKNLAQPATLCILGRSPAILPRQPSGQTRPIDIWHPASVYDSGDLARACESAGVLHDPKNAGRWTRQRSVTLKQLERMIERLTDPIDQETARDDLVFAR